MAVVGVMRADFQGARLIWTALAALFVVSVTPRLVFAAIDRRMCRFAEVTDA
jgi:hypothetical protein